MITPFRIILLGTGTSQGIPVIGCRCEVCTSADSHNRRLRTAAFIQYGDLGIALDIGPDFRQQMLTNQLRNVHAVLLTHEHNDHISGLDDIRPVNFLYHRDIPIYGHPRTLEEMRRRFYYAFAPAYQYPGKPRVHAVTVGTEVLRIGEAEIIPVPIDHGDMPILGYRIGNLAYITDAKTIPAESMQRLQGLEVLILNALRFEPHLTHLNVEEAIDLCRQLKPGICYLTHISHEMGLHQEVEAMLPENMRLGYDGLTINLHGCQPDDK